MIMAGVLGLLVFLIGVVVPLVGGVLLLAISRRRGPEYPACGKCGYDVHASIGSVTRCPECGADFAQAGITAPRGKRNPFMVVTGLALIVLAIGCFGSSLLFTRANIARSQAVRSAAAAQQAVAAQNAAASAEAVPSETEEDPESD